MSKIMEIATDIMLVKEVGVSLTSTPTSSSANYYSLVLKT